MAVQDYKINYKSDFVLTINGDAGWAVPFCIKFWTGMPSQAYFVGFDGVKYVNCRVGDTPTQLLVMFDDHHLPIGKLKMQIAYHTTIEEFPGSVFDEVTNASDVIVTIDGTDYQVMLDFTGEDAPELEFDLPAYANEAERIQNELQRQQNEADRIAAELQREQATAAAVQGAENVNAQLNGTTLTVTNRNGVSTSVNTKGEQGEQGPVGPEGPQGEQGVSIVSFRPVYESGTTIYYVITFSDGHDQSVAIPKGAKGDTGATGPQGPQGPQGDTGVSITGFVETGETETDTLYNITFSNGTTQAVAIPKGEKGDKGDTGNPGPQGVQGPKGDTVTATDYTLYNVQGSDSQGAMSQDATTKAISAQTGYYTCGTAAGTAAKVVTVENGNLYKLTLGGHFKVKMANANTALSGVTLQVGSETATALYYNGSAVSDDNTWENGETISVYYDGTYYQASNAKGGGGKFSTGEEVGNVGIDKKPTKNSENIVESGGVYANTPSVTGGESELDIRDEESNILAQFYGGNFRTQKFDSAKAMVTGKTPVPLDIIDDNGRVIVRFENGHIKTRNFDSSNFASLFHSNLYQKKMCIIGDSYVANHNQSYTLTWHYKIAQENEMAYVNYGINGNGLVASGSPTIGTPVIDRYSEMDDDADYVIVVGGKNDYNKQLSIASFKTGLASICAGLIDKYVVRGSKIAFFTPWDDYDSGTDPSSIKLIEYVDAIIEVCGKYSIPVFDSSRKSSMFMFNSIFRTNYCQSSTDISHLNSDGHNLFKNKAFNFLNQL